VLKITPFIAQAAFHHNKRAAKPGFK